VLDAWIKFSRFWSGFLSSYSARIFKRQEIDFGLSYDFILTFGFKV